MEQDPIDSSILPWICPECFGHLAGPEASQNQARLAFRTHANGAHWRAWKNRHQVRGSIPSERPRESEEKPVKSIETRPGGPATVRPGEGEFWCPKSRCTWRGALYEVKQHLLDVHDGSWHPGMLVRQLPFDLLPPGRWSFDQVLEHYRQVSSGGNNRGDRRIDYSRLEAIRLLSPSLCWVGKRAWKGYVTFEFPHHRGVVLECPITGNATYVIGGDWKRMISLTKAEIRGGYHSYERVNHTAHWLKNLKRAFYRFQ